MATLHHHHHVLCWCCRSGLGSDWIQCGESQLERGIWPEGQPKQCVGVWTCERRSVLLRCSLRLLDVAPFKPQARTSWHNLFLRMVLLGFCAWLCSYNELASTLWLSSATRYRYGHKGSYDPCICCREFPGQHPRNPGNGLATLGGIRHSHGSLRKSSIIPGRHYCMAIAIGVGLYTCRSSLADGIPMPGITALVHQEEQIPRSISISVPPSQYAAAGCA